MEYIYRTPWEFLFGTEGTKRAIFFMGEAFLVLILLFSSCGAAEKGGMELIINTSAVGKKEVLMKKTCICMITAIVIYIFAYLPELIGVLGTYGTGSLDAPIASFLYSDKAGSLLTMGGYLILRMGGRLVLIIFAGLIVLVISQKVRNRITTILIGTAILLIPIIIVEGLQIL